MENTEHVSRRRYRIRMANGEEVRGYTLFDNEGHWIGYVTLEFSDREHWGRLMCVTDYGNYACHWGAIGKSFREFLIHADCGYITDKMAAGHGEWRTLDAGRTRDSIRGEFAGRAKGEDADWTGARLMELDRCECEADFYAWAEDAGVEDVYERFVWGWGGYLTGLCSRLLPELKRALRMEDEWNDGETQEVPEADGTRTSGAGTGH